MAAIVAEDVRRAYGDVVALNGVSLTVDAGEVFALIGPNGAGKTTLVRALTGTTDAEGRVRVLGDAPDAVDPERVGVLPQDFDPAERLTARELVAYYAGLYDDSRPVDAALADVGLGGAADTYFERLSGGQRRRACVATALVNEPDVLFLDEPTTGIDPAGRRAVWRLVEDLAAGGTTVVLTTHDMGEAERLADRVGLLADGRLVATGTPDDLVAAHGGSPRLAVETPTPAAARAALAEANYRIAAGGGRDADDWQGAHGGDSEAYGLGSDARGEREARDDRVVVPGAEPTTVAGVAERLEAAGVDYDALRWRQPGLEDVYLALTDGEADRRSGTNGRSGASERGDADGTGDEEGARPQRDGGASA